MDMLKFRKSAYRIMQGAVIMGMMAFIAVSCNDSANVSGPEAGQAQMKVNLTDAPGDYQEVNVDVQGLKVHYTPSSEDTADADGKWIDLPMEPMKVNLLELTNGVDTLLSSTELEPGTYRELRLMLGDNNTVMVDSMTQNLKVPSGQQSGYKIKFETEVEAGDEIEVMVDFDAGRSVHKAGNSGKYILRPVLKAFVESGNEIETGSITGMVDPAEADPNIYVTAEDDTVASTQPDTTGNFLFEGLEDGLYNLNIAPTNDQYDDTTLTNVMVEEDEETDVGTVSLNEN